nr:hypothetical protein [Tanacetum cinerariifolium]
MAMLTMRARSFFRRHDGIWELMELLQLGLICQSAMVWAAMTRAFRQKKNRPTMPSWHSPLQVLPVLIMRYQSGIRYHVVPPPYTGTFMTPKPDLVFHDAPNVNETFHTAFNVELSLTKPDKDLSQSNRPTAPIIEDWVSDSEDESKAEPSQNDPSFVQPTEHVKTPRPSVKPVEHSIPAIDLRKDSPKSKGHGNSRNRKACFVWFPAQSNSSSNTIALDSPYLLVLNTGASQSRQH